MNNSNDPKEKAKETQDKPSLEVLAAKKSFFENVSLKHFSIFGIVLLMLFGIIIFGKSYFMTGLVAPDTPIASDTRSSSMSLTKITTSTPSGTPSPASIKTGSTPSTSPSPTSTLGIGSTTISERDGIMLIYVPAGEFEMGNVANAVLRECHKTFTDCQLDWFSDEEPVHTVALDAYWIDQTEVTNAMYAECVNAGICNLPSSVGSYSRGSYYGNTEFDDFPVINVSWIDASAYCEWADRRLPIEAEWEKAAGWDEEKHSQRFYPWGDEFDGTVVNFCDNKCDFNWKNANYDDGHIETARVGSYPGGASFYGVYDMAGNIREWVADWYDVYPGGDKSVDDDYGKKFRVLRGGGWDTLDSLVHSTERSRNNPSDSHSNIGFRCALSASSEVSP